MNSTSANHTKIAMHVSRWSVAVNVLLTLFKLLAGIVANSGAMISDAVHSASDVLSTFMVMISVKMAGRSPDSDHEYGHERMESIASILLAVALALTGAGIGYAGIQKIQSAATAELAVPGVLALVAAAVSIATKEGMYWYTRHAAHQIGSTALMADAWHHRSDALSSVGSLIGVAAARLGYPLGDPIASIVICLFIFKVSIDIFRSAASQLTDHACSPELETQMRTIILQQPGVLGLDLLQTRQFGARIYVDVEISANGNLSLTEAHGIAERVHDVIEHQFPSVKHCMVHVNPSQESAPQTP
jgi:cation diffusion facilitator family transporter